MDDWENEDEFEYAVEKPRGSISIGGLISNVDMEGMSLKERKSFVIWLHRRQIKEYKRVLGLEEEMSDDEYREELRKQYSNRAIKHEIELEARSLYPQLFKDSFDQTMVPYDLMTPIQFEKYVRKVMRVIGKKQSSGHDGIFKLHGAQWALEVKTTKITKKFVDVFFTNMKRSKVSNGLMITRSFSLPSPAATNVASELMMDEQVVIKFKHISEIITRGIDVEV